MKEPVKKFIRKSRDGILSSVYRRIDSLDLILAETDKKIELLQNELRDLNNKADALENQIKNSGVIQISEKEMIAKLFTGIKMYLDPRDISVSPHIALDSIWEHHITKAWLSVIQPEWTILDIGANFGYFGAIAAQKTNKKKSSVILFEPNPELIPYIKKTLAVNWLNEQSVVENLAVSDKNGSVELNVLKDYIASSSLHTSKHIDEYMHNKMYVKTDRVINVKSVTIDDYCRQNKIDEVNLIKMDIEGFEDRAYSGMREMVKRSKDITLFVEFTKESYANPKDYYDQMLADFGHVYVIDSSGNIIKPQTNRYQDVIGNADDWVMPVFSKRRNLNEAV